MVSNIPCSSSESSPIFSNPEPSEFKIFSRGSVDAAAVDASDYRGEDLSAMHL